ncbi:MFS transporter [Salininema proteolyticum]|uniref:MFS transporter n=1 Tax=Salininema proteolyticum TaxID=1607685 RepID=A0ABV8TZ94_9ACTN
MLSPCETSSGIYKRRSPDSFALRRHRALLVLGVAQLTSALVFYVPVSALFLVSRGLSYQEIFLLEGVLSAVVLLAEVPAGHLADRAGRRGTLTAGFAVAAGAEVLFAVGGGLPAYLASFALSGLSIALLSGVDSAYVYESLGDGADRHATTAFGRLAALDLVGGTVSAVVGPLLAASWGIAAPAYAAAGAACAALAIVLLLPAERSSPPRPESAASSVLTAAGIVFRSPVLLYAAVASGGAFAVFNAVHTLDQPLFQGAGVPQASFGVVVGAGMLAAAAADTVVGRLERRIGRRALLFAATAIGSAGFVLLAVPLPAVAIAGFGAVVLGMNLRGPVLSAVANRLLPDSRRATALSLMSSMGSVVGIGANLGLGALAERDPASASLAAAGVLAVVALLGLRYVGREESGR